MGILSLLSLSLFLSLKLCIIVLSIRDYSISWMLVRCPPKQASNVYAWIFQLSWGSINIVNHLLEMGFAKSTSTPPCFVLFSWGMDLRIWGGLHLIIGNTYALCGMKAMLWTFISALHPSCSLCCLRYPILAAAWGYTHMLDGETRSSIILCWGRLAISPLHPFCLKKINTPTEWKAFTSRTGSKKSLLVS